MHWPGHTGIPGVAPREGEAPTALPPNLGHATLRGQTLPDKYPIHARYLNCSICAHSHVFGHKRDLFAPRMTSGGPTRTSFFTNAYVWIRPWPNADGQLDRAHGLARQGCRSCRPLKFWPRPRLGPPRGDATSSAFSAGISGRGGRSGHFGCACLLLGCSRGTPRTG